MKKHEVDKIRKGKKVTPKDSREIREKCLNKNVTENLIK